MILERLVRVLTGVPTTERKGIEPTAGAPVRNGDVLVPGYDR